MKPDLYGEILRGVDLKMIYLKEFRGHIRTDLAPKAATVDISSDAHFVRKAGSEVEISQKWDIIATDKDTKSEYMNLSVTYGLVLQTKRRFTKAFFEVYEKTSLPLNVWPFVREFVNSMTARMNVPPLTLPLFKIVKKEK